MPRVDLSGEVPPVGNQGGQGSCGAWATSYYHRSQLEYRERHWDLADPNHRFSPSFLCNQVKGQPGPTTFMLAGPYPNPFDCRALFSYALPGPTELTFTIYNATGALVRRISHEHDDKGCHYVEWDGCDNHGIDAPAGGYFARLETGNWRTTAVVLRR